MADQLELQRLGPQHQAGSDSLLTGAAFFKMRELFFEDNIDDGKYCGHLYGLGTSFVNGGVANDSTAGSSSAETNSVNNSSSLSSTSSAPTTTVSTSVASSASTVTEVNSSGWLIWTKHTSHTPFCTRKQDTFHYYISLRFAYIFFSRDSVELSNSMLNV